MKKTLDSYGPDARFSGGFVSSFSQAVDYLQTATSWTEEGKLALNDAWFSGMQKKSGFFVVGVHAKNASCELKDVLLLDPQGKRFISLDRSRQIGDRAARMGMGMALEGNTLVLDTEQGTAVSLEENAASTKPAPVGDVEYGQALIARARRLPVNFATYDFSGYIANFAEEFAQVEKEFGVEKWLEILRKYRDGKYLYAEFVPRLEDVVAVSNFYPGIYYISNYHGVGSKADAGRQVFLEDHLYDVIKQAREEKNGFFVVFKMRINPPLSIVSRTEEDVLILDLKNKRFISLEESIRLAENHK